MNIECRALLNDECLVQTMCFLRYDGTIEVFSKNITFPFPQQENVEEFSRKTI